MQRFSKKEEIKTTKKSSRCPGKTQLKNTHITLIGIIRQVRNVEIPALVPIT